MVCPLYSKERQNFISFAGQKYPNTANLTLKIIFFWLMTQEDTELIKFFARNVNLSFQKRESYHSNKKIVTMKPQQAFISAQVSLFSSFNNFSSFNFVFYN